MVAKDGPILIVGGGLGGLSAGLALARGGRQVQIFEQAQEIAPIGYGIQLGPNVFPIFDELGVTDAVMRYSHLPPSLIMMDALTGERLIKIPVNNARFKERFKHPYVVIHRADIHNVLLDACKAQPGIELNVATPIAGFEDHGRSVKAIAEDGRAFEGVALIGADGLRSRIRERIAPDEPKPIGYVAQRTIIAMKDVPADLPHQDDVVLWAGPGFHVVTYPLRGRTIFNVVAVFRSSNAHNDKVTDYAAEVESVYRDSQRPLKALLKMLNLERRWLLADRDPIRNWSRGCVTLLGDAAHPTLQSYAQGACMAIEDAICLAHLVEGAKGSYEEVFQEYGRQRLVRTARVQLGSRSLWEFYHAEGIARDVRNAEAVSQSAEDRYNCLAWLWDGIPQRAMQVA